LRAENGKDEFETELDDENESDKLNSNALERPVAVCLAGVSGVVTLAVAR
jgi:hypothetical protein